MGCIPNSGIHTFTETCAEGNAPCPYPYHLESNGGSISFNCPDAEAEDHCIATFGPDFHMSPCLELGCVLTDDSTYEEWCVSSEEVSDDEVGIGSVCPSDCYLQNHIGVINFICPDQETENMCTATFGPNFTLDECLHLGCHLSEDSTYEEWCEGGSCGYPDGNGTGGTGTDGGAVPVPGPDGCPPGFELHQSGNMIIFNCPDYDSEIQCQSTYAPGLTMYMCLSLGCILDSSSDWQEWYKPRRRMFATNRFVTSACSGQSVTSRLRRITSWHMFVMVNLSFHAYACHEVHFVAKFMQSRTCPEVKSPRSYFRRFVEMFFMKIDDLFKILCDSFENSLTISKNDLNSVLFLYFYWCCWSCRWGSLATNGKKNVFLNLWNNQLIKV